MDVTDMLLVGLVFCACLQSAASNEADEYIEMDSRVRTAVLSHYEKDIIPRSREHYILPVSLGMTLIRIENVDIHENTITLRTWMPQRWNDVRLKWDPAIYNGTTQIRVPASKIWTPDITLYNSVSDARSETSDPQAVVSSNGDVFLQPTHTVVAFCRYDLTYFPFDRHACAFKWYSRAYNGFLMDLDFLDDLESVDVNEYFLSEEWVLEQKSANKHVRYYICCEEPYPDLTFMLTIKRQGSSIAKSYVLPVVLCALLSCLTFLIPSGSNQKFNMGCCLLVVLTLLLGRIEGLLPLPGPATPLIVEYHLITFVLLAFVMGIECLTGNMMSWSSTSRTLPTFLTKMVGCLGKVLLVNKENYMTPAEQVNTEKDGENGGSENSASVQHQLEWRLLAVILDRIFFLIFFLMTVVFSALLLRQK